MNASGPREGGTTGEGAGVTGGALGGTLSSISIASRVLRAADSSFREVSERAGDVIMGSPYPMLPPIAPVLEPKSLEW